MTNPRDLERRVSQTRNDVDSLFDLLRETNEKASTIANVQQVQGDRLDQIEQILERMTGRLDRLQGTQLNQTDILDSHTEILDSHTEKLNEIVALLRERPES
jgi:hypothetical protein